MKKITHVSLLLVVAFGVSTVIGSSKALAITATSSASRSASDSAKSMIKEQVEKAIKQQANDPEVKGMALALKSQKFGIIGTLEKIIGSMLQVRSPKGSLRLIELDRSAVILNQSRQITKEDLELNAPVIVMGYKQSDDTLLARRVVISDDSIFGNKRQSITGKLSDMNTKQITLSLQNAQGNIYQAVKYSAKTQFLNTLGMTIKRTDMKTNDQIVAIFNGEATASASAVRVYSLAPISN